jgi:hypothetical protein
LHNECFTAIGLDLAHESIGGIAVTAAMGRDNRARLG